METGELILTFLDPDGVEWIAAARIGPLRRRGSDETVEPVDMEERFPILRLKEIKVVSRGG